MVTSYFILVAAWLSTSTRRGIDDLQTRRCLHKALIAGVSFASQRRAATERLSEVRRLDGNAQLQFSTEMCRLECLVRLAVLSRHRQALGRFRHGHISLPHPVLEIVRGIKDFRPRRCFNEFVILVMSFGARNATRSRQQECVPKDRPKAGLVAARAGLGVVERRPSCLGRRRGSIVL